MSDSRETVASRPIPQVDVPPPPNRHSSPDVSCETPPKSTELSPGERPTSQVARRALRSPAGLEGIANSYSDAVTPEQPRLHFAWFASNGTRIAEGRHFASATVAVAHRKSPRRAESLTSPTPVPRETAWGCLIPERAPTPIAICVSRAVGMAGGRPIRIAHYSSETKRPQGENEATELS